MHFYLEDQDDSHAATKVDLAELNHRELRVTPPHCFRPLGCAGAEKSKNPDGF